ncbi:hypothetical protein [Vibrio aestuarianus]|uniref:hypothetical protein n=1 Tax=Vibrio aestuarianus TaxID=28171 RepID=UPI00237C8C2D|nr:hypothetical protein [Vibrio aestuarianus]MDE1327135.1 hypothetical protein [Vibrio aestuarianus]
MSNHARLLTLIMMATTSFFIIAFQINYNQYGLDFTDEGFYLNWVSNPYLYSYSVTQFGFVLNPIFEFLERDLVLFRIVSNVISFILMGVLSFLLMAPSYDSGKMSKSERIIFSFGISSIAITSVAMGNLWLATPSYNSLTLQTILLVLIGLSTFRINRFHPVALLSISLGLTVLFLSKGTSFLLLSITILIYFSCLKEFKFLVKIFIVSIVFLLASAYLIDGSVSQFVKRVINGLLILKALGAGHSENLFALEPLLYSIYEVKLFFSTVIMTSFLFLLPKILKAWGEVICYILGTTIVIFLLVNVDEGYSGTELQGLFLLAVPISSLLLLYAFKYLFKKNSNDILPIDWKLFIVLLVSPYIYSFGTNNNVWSMAAGASYLWLLSGLIILQALSHRKLIPLIIVSQVFTAFYLHVSVNNPYRQSQPLYMHLNSVQFKKDDIEIKVDEATESYILELKATRELVPEGVPILDFTGRVPMSVYLLNGKAIGTPWLLTNTKKFFFENMKSIDCGELSRSWLITEPTSARALPTTYTKFFGKKFPEDFELMKKINIHFDHNGNSANSAQYLYRPRYVESNCEYFDLSF